MSRLFIFTAADAAAREQLSKSMDVDVPLDDLRDLPADLLAEVRRLPRVRCWGPMPHQRNRATWESMQAGDVGIGYTDQRFRYAGRIYRKAQDHVTANRIWGTAEDETWGLFYFFDPLQDIDVEVAAVREALDYESKWVPRGFFYPGADKQALLREKFGSIDEFVAELGTQIRVGPVEADEPFGIPYRRARTDIEMAEPQRCDYDPDSSGRGVNAHNELQNTLAEHLKSLGIAPLSADKTRFKYDIAWERGGVTLVGEVKSTTSTNEEDQLRKGLGEVLRYRQLALRSRDSVEAVLIAERRPSAESAWLDLCASVEVMLTWPERFSRDIT